MSLNQIGDIRVKCQWPRKQINKKYMNNREIEQKINEQSHSDK